MMISDVPIANIFPDPEAVPSAQPLRTISRRTFLRILPFAEFGLDFITCASVMCAVEIFRHGAGEWFARPFYHTLAAWSAYAALFAAALLRRRTVEAWTGLYPICDTSTVVWVCLRALMLLLVARPLLPTATPPETFALELLLLPPIFALQKRICFQVLQKLQSKFLNAERVIIYGDAREGRRLAYALHACPRLALRTVAVVDARGFTIDHNGDTGLASSQLEARSGKSLEDLLKTTPCDLLLIVGSSFAQGQQERLSTIARQSGVRVMTLTEADAENTASVDAALLTEFVYRKEGRVAVGRLYRYSKRLIDIMVSSILLILLAPLFLIISLLVRLDSKGPAFFVQKRVGRDGALFRILKFRSMSATAPRYGRSPQSSDDPRITAVGRILRRTSLDELPQLINVFLGQMSLVGPRPEMPFIVRRYDSRQRLRLQVTPGITGPWRLSRDRSSPIHENLHHDLLYIRHQTFSMDLAILLHTFFFAMRGGI